MNRTGRAQVIISKFDRGHSLLGAEVGVYDARTSVQLLEELPELYLILVDRWKPYSELERKAMPDAELPTKDEREFEAVYTKVLKRVEPYKHRAIVRRQESIKEARLHEDATLSFVFIDADHSYSGVMDDLKWWVPKVAPGGYVFVHDYGAKRFPGVKQAVDAFFGRDRVAKERDNMAVVRV